MDSSRCGLLPVVPLNRWRQALPQVRGLPGSLFAMVKRERQAVAFQTSKLSHGGKAAHFLQHPNTPSPPLDSPDVLRPPLPTPDVGFPPLHHSQTPQPQGPFALPPPPARTKTFVAGMDMNVHEKISELRRELRDALVKVSEKTQATDPVDLVDRISGGVLSFCIFAGRPSDPSRWMGCSFGFSFEQAKGGEPPKQATHVRVFLGYTKPNLSLRKKERSKTEQRQQKHKAHKQQQQNNNSKKTNKQNKKNQQQPPNPRTEKPSPPGLSSRRSGRLPGGGSGPQGGGSTGRAIFVWEKRPGLGRIFLCFFFPSPIFALH